MRKKGQHFLYYVTCSRKYSEHLATFIQSLIFEQVRHHF